MVDITKLYPYFVHNDLLAEIENYYHKKREQTANITPAF